MVRIGGLKVLMSFTNLGEALSLVQAFKFDFDQVFSSLERWVPRRPRSPRLVWFGCYGVPFFGWDKKISGRLGVGRVR